MTAIGLLLGSRKFWTLAFSLLAVGGALVMVMTGKIGKDELVPTIVSITTLGATLIASIAWEDGKAKAAGSAPTTPAAPIRPAAPSEQTVPPVVGLS